MHTRPPVVCSTTKREEKVSASLLLARSRSESTSFTAFALNTLLPLLALTLFTYSLTHSLTTTTTSSSSSSNLAQSAKILLPRAFFAVCPPPLISPVCPSPLISLPPPFPPPRNTRPPTHPNAFALTDVHADGVLARAHHQASRLPSPPLPSLGRPRAVWSIFWASLLTMYYASCDTTICDDTQYTKLPCP